jgi:hypothetical protein
MENYEEITILIRKEPFNGEYQADINFRDLDNYLGTDNIEVLLDEIKRIILLGKYLCQQP